MKKFGLFVFFFIFLSCSLIAEMYQFKASLRRNYEYDTYAYFSEDYKRLYSVNVKFKKIAAVSNGNLIVGDIYEANEIPSDIYRYNPEQEIVVYKVNRGMDGRNRYLHME